MHQRGSPREYNIEPAETETPPAPFFRQRQRGRFKGGFFIRRMETEGEGRRLLLGGFYEEDFIWRILLGGFYEEFFFYVINF